MINVVVIILNKYLSLGQWHKTTAENYKIYERGEWVLCGKNDTEKCSKAKF